MGPLRSGTRRWLLTGVLCLGAAVVVGCSEDGNEAGMPTPEKPAPAIDSPLALYGDPETWNYNGNDAEISGVLRRDGNCLYIESGSLGSPLDGSIEGPHRTLLALHAGITEWDEDRQLLTVAGREMELDEPVMFGGSGGDLSGVDWHIPPDPACEADEGWIAGEPGDPVLQAGWLTREYGYSETEASELNLALIAAGPIVADLQVLVADRLAGAWPVYGPDARVVVRLTGDAPTSAEAEALAATSPIPVEFRLGADYTVRELGEASLGIRQKLANDGWFQGAQVDARENAVMAAMDAALMDVTPQAMAEALSTEFGIRVVPYIEEQPEFGAFDPDEAFHARAQRYADELGISIEEAIQRLERQGEAGEYGARLQSLAGDRYAGHWVQYQPEYGLVLALSGDEPAPAGILALAESGPVPVTVSVGAHSYAELIAAQAALNPVPPAVAGTYVDVRRNAVVVMWAADLSESELAAMEADWLAEHGVPVFIELIDKPGLDGGDE